MIINEKLKNTHPEKQLNMYRTIFDYMKSLGYDERNLSSASCAHKNLILNDSTYAKHIEIISSCNEPKIYAYVYAQNDDLLYCVGLLSTDPKSYALVAEYAGLFMETFNQYIDINFCC